MERSALSKNLSSSRQHAIQNLLHAQNPTKKFTDLFDAHSQTGNNTGQPLFMEDLVVTVLGSFSNTMSLSSSAESDEVLQVPTNACVRSGVSGGSESVNTPLPSCVWGGTCRSYFRCAHQIDQQCQATKLAERTSLDPRLFLITYRGRHTCEIILESPQLILDPPSPWNDSIRQSFNTSLIAKQYDGDHNNPIFFDFLSVNQEQKLPSEDDLNPHGHDSSNNNNQSTSSNYVCDLDTHSHSHGDNSSNNNQSTWDDFRRFLRLNQIFRGCDLG